PFAVRVLDTTAGDLAQAHLHLALWDCRLKRVVGEDHPDSHGLLTVAGDRQVRPKMPSGAPRVPQPLAVEGFDGGRAGDRLVAGLEEALSDEQGRDVRRAAAIHRLAEADQQPCDTAHVES